MMNRAWWLGGSDGEGGERLWDRGLRFGMSVFETIAVFDGRPLFLEEHLVRIEHASRDLLGVPVAPMTALPLEELATGGETGVLRVYVTAGTGGILEPVTAPDAFALFERCEIAGGPGAGWRLAIERAPMPVTPGGWKTGNYWANVRARQEATARGYDEAVVADPSGAVMGASMGNLFVVDGGRLMTPPLETGARPGVVRQWVMERTEATEELLTFETLRGAGEIFITNSRVGLATVSEFDGHPLTANRVAASLAAQYCDEILSR